MCPLSLPFSKVEEKKFVILGGFDGSECMRTCEVYNVESNEWSYIPEMLKKRSGSKCVGHKGQIYVMGGYNGVTRLIACEKYNPKLHYWSPISDMHSPRSNFGIEVIEDAIFVAGGFDGISTINKVECYKIEENQWYNIEKTNSFKVKYKLKTNILDLGKWLLE